MRTGTTIGRQLGAMSTQAVPIARLASTEAPDKNSGCMHLIDLSHPLIDKAPAFPNDPKLAVLEFGRIATHKYNITQVLMGTHQGTHLDAMFTFIGFPLNFKGRDGSPVRAIAVSEQ